MDKKGVELIPMSRTLSMRSLCREAKSSFALDSMGLNAVYGMATVGMCGGDDDVVSRGMSGFSLSVSYDSVRCDCIGDDTEEHLAHRGPCSGRIGQLSPAPGMIAWRCDALSTEIASMTMTCGMRR